MDLGVLGVLGVGVVEVLDGGVHFESLSHLSFLLAGLVVGVLQLAFGSQYVFGLGVLDILLVLMLLERNEFGSLDGIFVWSGPESGDLGFFLGLSVMLFGHASFGFSSLGMDC